MFSSRTRWDLMTNRLASLVAARRAAGAPLIDLTLSNPTEAERISVSFNYSWF